MKEQSKVLIHYCEVSFMSIWTGEGPHLTWQHKRYRAHICTMLIFILLHIFPKAITKGSDKRGLPPAASTLWWLVGFYLTKKLG